ncbi:C4-dicarboxylate ABC transporter [Siminovitchia terrae]|uniref:C4-dicarboxylate ABC transporter n=3 Tax=Siminovitchia terrae TaxID=1914933 RepID=A0A429X2B9_SIMTE|nr:TRAP transporter permease [Siminovitchia terrae]RST57533.1 TRAP transporter permease [Siminovitchia terrae]GIN90475.1 C4-dicarboxylate ABC transporter [Siminovitchia terrae]GIN97083.1 C4-dicarboxylate ABC transporter [Siminovitchia terrae]
MKEKEHLDAQEILEKYDRENQFRASIGKWAWIVTLLGVSLTVFHLYTGYFGTLPSQKQGAIHLGTALGIIYLLFPAKKGMHKVQKKVPWYDVVLAFTAMYVTYHKIFFFDSILKSRISGYSTIDIIISIIGILLVLEATRRTVGVPIVVVASITILYAIFGKHIPTTILSHPGFSVDRIAPNLWYQESGVFGTPVQISAKFIFLFLFFGVMLVHTKIGQFFNDLAFSLTGRFTGGTAKTAVVASALQGMVSGSSVGNTVASGSFTIPMMKKSGFTPEFAGATEASASTGGQIMPPIMGAAAFIMMEYLGVPYSTIMLAAMIPAVLYFTGIFIGTHFEAKRLKIFGLPKSQLPVFKDLMIKNGFMLLPVVVMIGTILSGFTPQRAALLGIGAVFIVSLVRKDTRLSIRKIFEVLEQGARVALPVIAAVATAGIIAGVVSMTGLGAKFASGIIALSSGHLILALFFTMIACIILGMGLPTTANYVVTATVAAPALINEFGLAPIAVHMFVFYFGIVADITPPVCLAAYAGAGIARANPFKTGVIAVKLAIAAFIVPYIFIYNPILVLVDVTPLALIFAIVTSLIGMAGISSAVVGFYARNSFIWERLALFAGGLMMIFPETISDFVGAAILLGIWFIQKQRKDDSGQIKPQISM